MAPLTDARRNLRRKHLTATDVPAVLGLNPWRSPRDVWTEKIREVAPSEPSEAAEVGIRLENGVIEWAADTLMARVVRNQFRVAEDALFSASFDALITPADGSAPTEGLEAKTSGILSGRVGDEWGEPGTDEIPPMYLVQTQVQAFVGGLERVWVPALLGGRGFAMYVVERDEALIQTLTDSGRQWWERYVVAETPPPDGVASEDLLKRIVRVPDKTVEIEPITIAVWLDAKAQAKAAADQEALAKARVIEALGDAEIGISASGQITFKQQSGGKRLDAKRLVGEHPELAATFEPYWTESRFPVLRWKAAEA